MCQFVACILVSFLGCPWLASLWKVAYISAACMCCWVLLDSGGVLGMYCFCCCIGVAVYLGALCLAVGALHASRFQHQGLLSNCMRAPMTFYDTTPIGRIINRFSKDTDTIDTTIPQNLLGWLMCTFRVLATLVVVGYSTPYVLAAVSPLGLFYYIVQVLMHGVGASQSAARTIVEHFLHT